MITESRGDLIPTLTSWDLLALTQPKHFLAVRVWGWGLEMLQFWLIGGVLGLGA